MIRRKAVVSFACISVLALLFLSPILKPLRARRSPPASEPQQKTEAPVENIVIGFLGGFVNQENPVHAEVQLAVRLRKAYPSGVDVETFEDRHVAEARRKILALLSGSSNTAPNAAAKQNARIVLYGHSWGGAATLELARELQRDGIPVALTIQVDSVSRYGDNDSLIPSNVLRAANFYQTHGLLHGISKIHTADPSRTQIVGNFRFDYTNSPLKCSRYPWWDRYIVKAHTQIECDPVVWDKVESLIRSALPAAPTTPAK